jgi:hypothetical protein
LSSGKRSGILELESGKVTITRNVVRSMSACGAAAGVLLVALSAAAGTPPAALAGRAARTACVFPPTGSVWLPESCLHGPIQYLEEYPDVRLATPSQREFARRLHDDLVAAAKAQHWRDLHVAAGLGYNTNKGPRKPGDRVVHYFHAGRAPEPRKHGLLDPTRPKTLIYANAPGRPLVLVGAMWTTHPGERGPTPGGQFTRWHSHFSCGDRHSMTGMAMAGTTGMRGLTPNDLHSLIRLSDRSGCPAGTKLHLGRIEMMHIWFTHDLRSAFAVRPPTPELCEAGLVPARDC